MTEKRARQIKQLAARGYVQALAVAPDDDKEFNLFLITLLQKISADLALYMFDDAVNEENGEDE